MCRGIACNIITVIYYSAPVSSAIKVGRTYTQEQQQLLRQQTCLGQLLMSPKQHVYAVTCSRSTDRCGHVPQQTHQHFFKQPSHDSSGVGAIRLYYSGTVNRAGCSCCLQVVRTRNSASIYRPTCIANLANAALWVAYGVVSVACHRASDSTNAAAAVLAWCAAMQRLHTSSMAMTPAAVWLDRRMHQSHLHCSSKCVMLEVWQ